MYPTACGRHRCGGMEDDVAAAGSLYERRQVENVALGQRDAGATKPRCAGPSCRRLFRGGAQSAEVPIDVAAKVNARDGLLARVATFRVGDRVQLLEIRFLGQRRFVDVDAPLGPPSLDAGDLPCLQPAWRRLGS